MDNLKMPVTPPLTEEKKEGPPSTFWTIDVRFEHQSQTKAYRLKNLSGGDVMQFRNHIFTSGLYVKIDPGHAIIVPPWNIREVDIERQDKFHEL